MIDYHFSPKFVFFLAAVSAYKFPKKLTALEIENAKALKEKEKEKAKKAKQGKKGHTHDPSCPQSQEFKSKKRWIKTLADMPIARCSAGAVTVGELL